MKEQKNQKSSLLIEDNSIQQRILSVYLEKLNYRVEMASDGEIEIEKAFSKVYDLIITDLGLPKLSGKEVIQRIQQSEFNNNTPIIVVSAQISKSEIQTYINLGANAVLEKPVSLKDLAETIQNIR